LATADRFALVIGIDAYGSGIPALGSARKDAEAVAATLSGEHGYAVRLLLDGEATREAVTAFLTREVPSRLSAETPFLVYFAGHGVAEGEDGSKGPQGYLILQDAVSGKPETWLSMDVFRAALDALACRHLLVVLDCCYAGAFRWATASRDIGLVGQSTLYRSVYDRYLEGEAWQALTSASAAQKAADTAGGLPNLREVNADGHSPFAAALIQGLGGAADYSTSELPPDGVITATELYQYVSACLLPSPDAPTVQTPGIWPLKPGNEGEFVFMNPKVPLKVAPDPPLDDSNNPWLGLEAYTAEKKELFFGRDQATGDLVDRVAAKGRGRLVAVVGPSGAGKSSLVEAGLVPALDASRWTVVRLDRLAGDPSPALAAAVKELDDAPTSSRRLLVIHQFEELFTHCPDEGERSRFLKSLRDLIDDEDGPVVVLSVRSDFELKASEGEALKDIWQAARYQVPPLSSDELRQVLVGPAQVKAVYYDPAKVADDLFDEVSQTPSALPLFSFALAELYRQAQLRRRKSGAADRGLTTADYEAIGGVVGALNRRATQLYDDNPNEQRAVQRVFLRLVSQEGAGLTRRRVDRAELQFGPADHPEQQRVERVIQRYVDAGLLVIDGDSVEPAHDALVAQWQQLHDWLKASPQDLIRAAWPAARAWESNDKKPGYLWNADPRLPLLAAAHRAGQLNLPERAFETASTKRRKARRRLLSAITVAIIAALSAATVITIGQRNAARTELAKATSLALASVAKGQLGNNLSASLLLSLDAYDASTTGDAGDAMVSSLEWAQRLGIEAILLSQDNSVGVAFSPDRHTLAAAGYDGTVVLWDTATHKQLGQPLNGDQGGVRGVAFSPDGHTLAAAGQNGTVVLWDTNSHKQLGRSLNGNQGLVTNVAFSPDGHTLAAAGFDGTVVLWNTATDEQLARLNGNQGYVDGVAFSPDGHTFATAGYNGTVVLWDTATDKQLARLNGNQEAVEGVAFSPDGHMLAAACIDGTVVLWDTHSHKQLGKALKANQDIVFGVAFSPDGHTLAAGGDPEPLAGSQAGTVVLWNTISHKQLAQLNGNQAGVDGVAFSPDGRTLAAAGGTVVLWDTASDRRLAQPLNDNQGRVTGIAFSPDGNTLAAAGGNGTVVLWDTASNKQLGQPLNALSDPRKDYVTGVAFGPDGHTLAASCSNGTIVLWHTDTRTRIGAPLKYPGPPPGVEDTPDGPLAKPGIYGIAFSPDGHTLAAAGGNGTVVLWDTASHKQLGQPLKSNQGSILTVAFSPHGHTLAAGTDDGTVVLWDTASHKQLGQPLNAMSSGTAGGATGVAFSPNGHTLAAAGSGIFLWNTATHKQVGQPLTANLYSDSGIAFSPDGHTLAATTGDATVVLWDTASHKQLGQPLNSPQDIGAVAFSPDGHTLAAAANSAGSVVLWKGIFWSGLADLRTLVCGLVWGNLTQTEWGTLVPDLPYRTTCSS
jgi:WD40 repeat protein